MANYAASLYTSYSSVSKNKTPLEKKKNCEKYTQISINYSIVEKNIFVGFSKNVFSSYSSYVQSVMFRENSIAFMLIVNWSRILPNTFNK